MPHKDVTHARIREYYSSPFRNIREVWFSDIFTLKNLTMDCITVLCVLHNVSSKDISLTDSVKMLLN